MKVSEILKIADKRTPGKWQWDIPPYEEYDGEQYAPWLVSEKNNILKGGDIRCHKADGLLIAMIPEMEAKLRTIVELVPEMMFSLAGYAVLQENNRAERVDPDRLEILYNKLKAWAEE